MNGEVYEGGQTLHVTAPIDEIPVFIREGGPDLVDGWKKIRENHRFSLIIRILLHTKN